MGLCKTGTGAVFAQVKSISRFSCFIIRFILYKNKNVKVLKNIDILGLNRPIIWVSYPYYTVE